MMPCPVAVDGVRFDLAAQKRDIPKDASFLVPVAGLEPARCRQRWILSPLRLPIPSHRQVCIYFNSPVSASLCLFIGNKECLSSISLFRLPVAVPSICLRRRSSLASADRCHSLPSLDSATGGGQVAPHHTGRCAYTRYWGIIHHRFKNSKRKIVFSSILFAEFSAPHHLQSSGSSPAGPHQ